VKRGSQCCVLDTQSLCDLSLVALFQVHPDEDLTLAFAQLTHRRQQSFMELAALEVFFRITIARNQPDSPYRFVARVGLVADPGSPQVVKAAISVNCVQPSPK